MTAPPIGDESEVGHAFQFGIVRPDFGPNAVEAMCTVCHHQWVALDIGEDCPACVKRHAELGADVELEQDYFERLVRETPPRRFDLPEPLDFFAIRARDHHDEWLVEDFWPLGRQLHIHAPRKSRKSLVMLWIAVQLARGRDPFTGRPIPRMKVIYLDYEMTEDDVDTRLQDMDVEPGEITGYLTYYLFPMLKPLDTREGGENLMRLVERDEAVAVVLDTVTRIVAGEENNNDTFRDLYTYTIGPLKAVGISTARLDHEGHEGGRSRGASAKADDVDIVWQIKPTDDGVQLNRKATRVATVPEKLDLKQGDNPLRFERSAPSWPAGTATKAKELDAVGVPLDASRNKARELLKANGRDVGRIEILAAALRYRRSCQSELGIIPIGNKLGTPHNDRAEQPSGTDQEIANDLREQPREQAGTANGDVGNNQGGLVKTPVPIEPTSPSRQDEIF